MRKQKQEIHNTTLPREQLRFHALLVIVDFDATWFLKRDEILEIEIDVDGSVVYCIIDVLVMVRFHSHDTFTFFVLLDLELDAGFISSFDIA